MLKQILYAGIGLATVTKERAEEVISELVKKGEMSQEEGKDALNTLMCRMQEESEKLKQKINEQVDNAITSMNLVKKTELDEILQRIAELEKQLDEIQSQKEV
jgi:polyhydroxyalkanoate synthesis regulator phasin